MAVMRRRIGVLEVVAYGRLHVFEWTLMIKIPTVFILGAGASVPYGFPAGDALRIAICNLPNGGPISDRLGRLGFSQARISRLAEALATSALPSIDAFLARRQDHQEIGKIAMAAILLSQELRDGLHRVGGVYGQLDWYGELWARMTDGIHSVEELISMNNIRFITFNYDRSLEQFLYDAIKSTFSVGGAVATNTVQQFSITHVYGSLGPFEPQQRQSYGWPETGDLAEVALYEATKNIRVVPIDRDDQGRVPSALFEWAERVVVLGFGFDSVNCHRLGLADVVTQRTSGRATMKPSVYATTFKLTEAQCARGMTNLLGSIPQFGLHESPSACLDALRHWDVLT